VCVCVRERERERERKREREIVFNNPTNKGSKAPNSCTPQG
jgi:hypothetical protein